MTLSDGVVLLRPWNRAEAIFLLEETSDPAIQRYNSPTARSLAGVAAVIDGFERGWQTFATSGDPTGTAFAIVESASGALAGMCGIDQWSSTDGAQFGYWLAAGARGRGLATRSVTLMADWLFELGAARVFLTIASDNAASAAVARRAGFAFEDTVRTSGVGHGPPHDVDVFARRRHEWVERRGR